MCRATLRDFYKEDWCNTVGDCGSYNFLRGHWDYCLYKASSKQSFEELTWQEKEDIIWNKLRANPTLGEYQVRKIFTESVKTSFLNEWDELPAGRK